MDDGYRTLESVCNIIGSHNSNQASIRTRNLNNFSQEN